LVWAGLQAQKAIRSPINMCSQEGNVAVSFRLHGELSAVVDTVQVRNYASSREVTGSIPDKVIKFSN
jgi:hypothetical protein